MVTKTHAYDTAKYLDDEKTIAAYLAEAFEDADPQLIAVAIGNVAKARSMSDIAQKAGVSRESLYRSLSAGGNPSFSTILKVMDALGMRLDVKVKHREAELT